MRYKEFEKIDTGREGFPALPPDSKPSRARRDGRDLLPKTVLNADPEAHVHTESEITDLGSYSPIGHGHVEADISDLGTYLTDITTEEIGDLSDVDTTTVAPTDGQALVWSAADSEWQPGTVASGGGGGSSGALTYIGRTTFSAATSADIALDAGYLGFLAKWQLETTANDDFIAVRVGPSSTPSSSSVYRYARSYQGTTSGNTTTATGTEGRLGRVTANPSASHGFLQIGAGYDDSGEYTTWNSSAMGRHATGYFREDSTGTYEVNNVVDVIQFRAEGGSNTLNGWVDLWAYTDTVASGGGTTAPTIVGTATAAGTGSSSSVTIPASTAVGDVMFLFASGGWTPTVPSKWKALDEQAGTNMGAFTAWKQAVSGDASSSVTVNFSGSFNHRLYLIVFDGETVGDFMFLTANRDSSNLVNPTQELGAQGYDVLVQCANQRQTTAAITFATGTSHHSDSATQAGALYTITGTGTPVGMSAASASGSPAGASYVSHIAVKPA